MEANDEVTDLARKYIFESISVTAEVGVEGEFLLFSLSVIDSFIHINSIKTKM